jgi:hypothetical protein
MLPDYGRYYGSAVIQVIEQVGRPISIEKLSVGIQGFYLLDARCPLYVKFSRNRRGPWSFNFQKDHQLQCQLLVERFGSCITALVCGNDGVVALSHTQIRQVLDHSFEDQEGVSVRRKLNKMYSVGGSNGELSHKISRDSLIEQLKAVLGDK